MGRRDKLALKFFNDTPATFDEAQKLLKWMGFEEHATGSHHVFRKEDYPENVSLKRRKVLLRYQKEAVRKALEDHGFKEEK